MWSRRIPEAGGGVDTLSGFRGAGVPLLRPGGIHLWMVPVEDSPLSFGELEMLLSPKERERAARFRIDEDRQRFLVGRGLLRVLLASHMDDRPDGLVLDRDRFGRPVLLPADASAPPSFNVSHSGPWVFIGLADQVGVGVDVEAVRPVEGLEGLASRVLQAEELGELGRLPPSDRGAAFFRCWTQKEACAKLAGTGLGADLRRFRVPVEPVGVQRDACPTRVPLPGAACWVWRMDPARGVMGAVATDRPGTALRVREWSRSGGMHPVGGVP